MFEKLQNIILTRIQRHKSIEKMIYYTMISSMNADNVVYLYAVKHDLRISTIFVGKQGQ